MMTRTFIGRSLHALASLALGTNLWLTAPAAFAADSYPSRPIQLVHGFGAGGNADVVARLIAQKLGESLGQPMVVDIKSGAGGAIASAHVANAKPDGYTLVMLTGAHTVSGALRQNLPYDSLNDFAFISTVSSFPFVVAVKADHPAKSLADLIAMSKNKAVSFSSVGVGSTQHMVGELLAAESGGEFLHIPFRGGGAPALAVLAGDVDMLSDTLTVAAPHLQSGGLRALAVTSAEIWPLAADIPPAAQTLPGFEVRSWLGLAAPKGTPDAIVQELNQKLHAILAQEDTQKALAQVGSMASPSTPEAMQAQINSEIARWKTVAEQRHIKVE